MGIDLEGRTRRRSLLTLSLVAAAGSLLPGNARADAVFKPWPLDRPTPPVELADIDGRAWSLDALRGQVVALNFWATWCEPCRDELPSLVRLGGRHRKAGLTVLAVNYREAVPAIRRFLELAPMPLPILLDSDGDAASVWTPRVFPTTVLVDRRGRAQTSVLGGLDWMGARAGALVEPLLARPRGV